jgi:hypothetical protein
MKIQLETASIEFAHNYFERHETNNYKALKQGFQEGAKWQQEQDKNKYSKEEVLEHLNYLMIMFSSKLDEFTDDEEMLTMKWFEQFKNK